MFGLIVGCFGFEFVCFSDYLFLDYGLMLGLAARLLWGLLVLGSFLLGLTPRDWVWYLILFVVACLWFGVSCC